MGYWKSKPNLYKKYGFFEIPEGNHRVQIMRVSKESFNNGKICYEVALRVSGQHGKLWYYLWYNPEDSIKTNRTFSEFFDSFQIEDHDLSNYRKWKGKMGAVIVEHGRDYSKCDYTYEYAVKVVWCIPAERQTMLPPWCDAPVASKELEKPVDNPRAIDQPF